MTHVNADSAATWRVRGATWRETPLLDPATAGPLFDDLLARASTRTAGPPGGTPRDDRPSDAAPSATRGREEGRAAPSDQPPSTGRNDEPTQPATGEENRRNDRDSVEQPAARADGDETDQTAEEAPDERDEVAVDAATDVSGATGAGPVDVPTAVNVEAALLEAEVAPGDGNADGDEAAANVPTAPRKEKPSAANTEGTAKSEPGLSKAAPRDDRSAIRQPAPSSAPPKEQPPDALPAEAADVEDADARVNGSKGESGDPPPAGLPPRRATPTDGPPSRQPKSAGPRATERAEAGPVAAPVKPSPGVVPTKSVATVEDAARPGETIVGGETVETTGAKPHAEPGRAAIEPMAATSRAPGESSGRPQAASAEPGEEVGGTDRVRFVQRVARAFQGVGQRGGVVRLRLSPPELGALRLEVSVRDGAMTARLEVENQAARHLLLDNLPALRERLAQQDIRIEQFSVDVGDPSSGGTPDQLPGRDAPPRGMEQPVQSVPRKPQGAPVVETRAPERPGEGHQLNVVV